MIERRQPSLRWSAVFAGAACSVGFWIVLQFLGLGVGLSAIDVENAGSLRGVGVGTTAWSLISPLIAMFCGGLIAGKLAQTQDRKVAGAHGLVMWALTSVLGLGTMVWMVTMIAAGAARGGAVIDTTGRMMAPNANAEARALTLRELGLDAANLLAPINQGLAAEGKATITVAELDAAVRGMVRSGLARGDFDQELLVDQLVATTRLSRAEAIEVERQIEARVDPSDPRAHRLERRAERYMLETADATGKALFTMGLSMLLSLIASVIGAVVALGRSRRATGGGPARGVRITEPGATPPVEPVTMAPAYPTQATGPASAVVTCTDTTAP